MIHTHNDNSVNFLSPGSGGREGGEDFGGSLSCHKRAVVLYCLCYMQRRNIGQPLPLVAIFFVRVLCEGQRVFAGN